MYTLPIQFDIVQSQGLFLVAVYINYFKHGDLRIHTNILLLNIEQFERYFGKSGEFFTRRWLKKGEAPYPGYCRAPGSGMCAPLLCNCEKLTEIYNNILTKQINYDGLLTKINY